MRSLRFQHQREIHAFAFRDIETTDCKESPPFRWVSEKFARNRRPKGDKTWTSSAHELSSAMLIQRCEKTLDAGAKIPDQTWLLELYRSKLHVRLQRFTRYLKELIRREKPRQHRRNHERDRNPDTRNCDRDARELGTRSEEHTSELQSLAYLVCR